VRILTCNILSSECDCEPEYRWSQRGGYCLEQIRAQQPDIFGLQECSHEQYGDFQAAFPEFDSYGMNCGQQAEGPPSEALFFRTERFDCTDSGGYLLDDERGCIANWIQLDDKQSGCCLHVTNTHLIWGSTEARLVQLARILRQTQQVDRAVPQLLMGDMNSVQDGPELELLLSAGWSESYAAVHGPGRQTGTNHAFCAAERDPEHAKVDWILCRGPWRFDDAGVIRERQRGMPASDHYFVFAHGSIAECG
jgi:mRNA deadenylase 3'-5' endonuclease subunit Ccr4